MMLSVFVATAQRTSAGVGLVTVTGAYNFNTAGGDVSYGTYLNAGYWNVFASAQNRRFAFSDGGMLHDWHAVVGGTYDYRFFETRDRSFGCYGGAGVFLGLESNKDSRSFYGENVSPYDGAYFIFGPLLRLELEWYVTPSLAFVGYGRGAYDFQSVIGPLMPVFKVSSGAILFDVGFGLRFTI